MKLKGHYWLLSRGRAWTQATTPRPPMLHPGTKQEKQVISEDGATLTWLGRGSWRRWPVTRASGGQEQERLRGPVEPQVERRA